MNLRLSTILIWILMDTTVLGVKVSDRFSKVYDAKARCLMQITEEMTGRLDQLPRELYSIGESFIKFIKINCSFSTVAYLETGLPDRNGSYSGLIGMVQRHEQDIATIAVRPDSLPFEPGKLTAPLLPADMTIISHRNKSQLHRHELTNFLRLDFCVYAYSAITLFFMVSVIYTSAEIILTRRRWTSSKRFLRKYRQMLLKVAALLVDQEQFNPLTKTGRVMCLSISIFFLVAVYGILLNTVGADLVVNIAPPKIDSLEDLLESPLQPYILKNLFMYGLLKASQEGSQLNKLWHVTGLSGLGVINFDLTNTSGTTKKIDQVINEVSGSTAAFIVPKVVTKIARIALCTFSPENSESLTEADHLFVPGFITGFMSPQIHPYTEKMFNYVSLTSLETGISTGLMASVGSQLPAMVPGGGKYDRKLIACVEERGDQTKELFFEPFSVKGMSSLFKAYFFLSLIAFVPLLFSRFMRKMLLAKKEKKVPLVQLMRRRRNQPFSCNPHSAISTSRCQVGPPKNSKEGPPQNTICNSSGLSQIKRAKTA